jgi:type IV secretion system protein TrbC
MTTHGEEAPMEIRIPTERNESRRRRALAKTAVLRAATVTAALAAVLVLGADAAQATPTGPAMPWDAPLQTLLDNLQGTVARILVTVAVVITGLLFAFGESGGAFRRVFGIAFGAAIALGALTVLSSLGFVGATF